MKKCVNGKEDKDSPAPALTLLGRELDADVPRGQGWPIARCRVTVWRRYFRQGRVSYAGARYEMPGMLCTETPEFFMTYAIFFANWAY